MAFSIGVAVIKVTQDQNSGVSTITSHTITKVNTRRGGSEVWVDNHHKPEDCLYAAYLWADTEEARLHLQRGIEMSARHKAEEGQFMKESYEQLNAQSRAGLR